MEGIVEALDEVLAIPRLKLELVATFGDLIGRPLLGEELHGKCFGEAKQRGCSST